MDAFFLSIVTVGIAEIGDRSLFLALLFGLRYQRPWPILIGMTAGLFANQAISAFVGIWMFQWLNPAWHAWIIAAAFLIMAILIVLPSSDKDMAPPSSSHQLIWTAAISFFFLEIADKSQLMVVTLAGSYQTFWPIALGATLGILATTAPALWLGTKFAHKIPVATLRWCAFVLFLVLAFWTAFAAIGDATQPINLPSL